MPDVAVPGWLDPDDIGQYDTSGGLPAKIEWLGTAHASASRFLAPSQVTLVLESELGTPIGASDEDFPSCEPINLTDPTVPALGAWFTLQSITGLEYSARSASYDIISRRTPIVRAQVRRAPVGSIALLTKTLAQRQRLLDLAASGRTLLLRNPDTSYPENNWYIALGNVQEERLLPDHRMPLRRLVFDFTVVDRPGGLIARSKPPTWADIDATYTSWGTFVVPTSVSANADTWSQLMTEQPAIANPVAMALFEETGSAVNASSAYSAVLQLTGSDV